MRKILTAIFLIGVAGAIGYLFWQVELKYTLPTPIPKGYQEVYINDRVFVNDTTETDLEKPIFYHFFTTSCPCSKFNLSHFNLLKRNFSDKMDFVVVIPEDDDLSKAREFFEGETKIIRDVNQQFAIQSGVYSTPQAVIINTDHKLYFRGNYNKARYCTDPFSNYAQMALDSLRSGAAAPDFGPLSTIAYGCGIDYL